MAEHRTFISTSTSTSTSIPISNTSNLIALGLELSSTLADLAATLETAAAAGLDFRQSGLEISLFCSVLLQVHATVTHAAPCRYSIGALAQMRTIVTRGAEVLLEIDQGIRRVDVARRDGDLLARGRLVFGHVRFQILRGALEACTVTLHIMLHNLGLARLSAAELLEEEKMTALVTDGLKTTRHATLHRLQSLETSMQFAASNHHPPPAADLHDIIFISRPPHPRHRLRKPKPQLPEGDEAEQVSTAMEQRRVSIWVHGLILDEEKNSLISLEFRPLALAPSLGQAREDCDQVSPDSPLQRPADAAATAVAELGTGHSSLRGSCSVPNDAVELAAPDVCPAVIQQQVEVAGRCPSVSTRAAGSNGLANVIVGDELFFETSAVPPQRVNTRAATEPTVGVLTKAKRASKDRRPLLFLGERRKVSKAE
ncbi:uncharacterized protein L3040_006924 [Drepanopeziza brunnea f. sp. 'multigermtubi']|uniref:uncharacterized protein n=1 Tax=Drepanopeziza brunnea f. sp. 'multigermtubi' TaxID=698441 RepID=UPI00239CDAAF|nr:hypothetical protein L3040_006924 [Drepanopeziza brunnea f. sp. 'multigermtubi']